LLRACICDAGRQEYEGEHTSKDAREQAAMAEAEHSVRISLQIQNRAAAACKVEVH
jgi:hypothetical protein